MRKILKEDKEKIDKEDFRDEIMPFHNFFLNRIILFSYIIFIIHFKILRKREKEKELTKRKEQLINN